MLQYHQTLSKEDPSSASKVRQGSFVVANEKGLHTRPCTELVKCACRFEAKINLKLDDITVNAKSILGILMLAACKGTKVKIEAQGEDAQQAIEALQQLAKQKFHMDY